MQQGRVPEEIAFVTMPTTTLLHACRILVLVFR